VTNQGSLWFPFEVQGRASLRTSAERWGVPRVLGEELRREGLDGGGGSLPRTRLWLPNSCKQGGVHGALIRARLREAAQAGARVAYVDTNVSSVSERNLHRYGFRLVCHLGFWSRPVSIGESGLVGALGSVGWS